MCSAKCSSGSQLRTVPANWEGKAGFYLPVTAPERLGWHGEGLAVPTAPGPLLLHLDGSFSERGREGEGKTRCQCGSKVTPPSAVPSPFGGHRWLPPGPCQCHC